LNNPRYISHYLPSRCDFVNTKRKGWIISGCLRLVRGRYMEGTRPVLPVISTKASRGLRQSYQQNSRTISATFTPFQFSPVYNSCLLFHFINSLTLTRGTN